MGGRGVRPLSAGTPCWGPRSACAGMVAPGLGADRAAGAAGRAVSPRVFAGNHEGAGPERREGREQNAEATSLWWQGKKGRREESSEKQGTPGAHTVLGRWREGVPGRGLHGQTREREPGEATADAGCEGAGWVKVCARLNPGGLRGRSGERIVSSLVSPQLLPFSVRGAEWPRQSRGPARGEARAVSRKAVRGSSRELRVAETGVGAQTEAPPPGRVEPQS